MKVAVLSGSPRGKYSITLQSVLYLQKKYKEDQFEIVDVGARIKSLQKDFTPVIQAVTEADLVLFAYPVYVFLAPSQLQYAVGMLKEMQKEGKVNLQGKCVAQITTSKHFYDVTAQNYIIDNVHDLGMVYLRGLCADMDDLTLAKGRRELESFWDFVRFRFHREQYGQVVSGTCGEVTDCSKYDIVIVTDCHEDPELEELIGHFRKSCKAPTRLANIHDFAFKGGCLGCFNCAAEGKCIYKDGFPDFLRNKVQKASAIVYAFRIKDHSMGPVFKTYDDRQFCNGHRMVTVGMPVGYLIKGDLKDEPNLKMVIEARASTGQNFLCRTVSDNDSPDAVEKLGEELVFALEQKSVEPQNFYGIGGMKIFRDLIWTMRGLMQADHKFYKENGVYDDFPQRHIGKMLQMKLIGWMMSNEKIKRKLGAKKDEGMVMPYKKVIDDLD